MLFMSFRAICFVTLLAAFPVMAAAQRTAAGVSGTVQDATGALVPGATVTARNVETGASRTVVTDAAGRYTLSQLSIGAYEFTVELQGFQTLVRRGVELAVGQDLELPFALSVGDVTESVVVTQQARLVETSPAPVASVIDSRQMREMPLNGRDFVQLATLQAGVSSVRNTNTAPDKGTGIRPSFAGARPYQTGYLLDGTDISTKSNFRTPGSAAGVTLGVEAVRELQVIVNSFGAEYGNAAGGIINAVTRSGTNKLSGSAFEFHRDSKFDARNYFDPPDEELPPFTRNQFGFSLGGPFKQNRLFWFTAYEGLREQLSRTLVALVPTAAAREGRLPTGTVPVNPVVKPYLDLWPLPNGRDFGDGTAEFISAPNAPTEEDFFVIRGDWNISAKDSLYARFSYDKAAQLSYHSPVPNIGVDQLSGYRFLTVEQTHIFSSASTNMVRVAYNHTRSESQDHFFRDIPESLYFVRGAPAIGRFTFGSQFSQTIHNPGSAGDNPAIDSMNILQLHDTFTWLRGAHTWRFGGMVNRYLMRNDSFPSGDGGGQYQFNSFADLLAGRSNNLRLTAPEAILGRAFRQWLFASYIQDEWRVSNRVTLNAGVRYEAITVPVEVNGYNSSLPDYRTGAQMVVGAPLFDNPSLKNFAPRVSGAWDVMGDGSLALRGGFGIYHDLLITNYLNQTSDANPPFTVRADIRNPVFPDALEALKQARTSTATTLNIFDLNDTRQPYLMQFNLSLQRALGADTSVTLAYVGSRGHQLQREVLVNPPQPIEQADGRLFFPLGAPRINPNFGAIFLRRQDGRSFYNSLQARLERRLKQGLQFEAAYTFARAVDDTSISHGATDYGAIQVVQHPFDSQFDRGLSNYHVAHGLVVNALWEMPRPGAGSALVQALLSGWQLGGIYQMSSGQPFSVIVGFDVANVQSTNNGTRPNLVPGADSNPIRKGNPVQYFDPSSFVLQERGYLGNLPRNTLIGPGLINLDAVLSRNIRIGRITLQGRLEVFNVLNRANFSNPSQTVVFDAAGPVGSAGRITSTSTTARQMQLGIKLLF